MTAPAVKSDTYAIAMRAALHEVARELKSTTVATAAADLASKPTSPDTFNAERIAAMLQKAELTVSRISEAQLSRWVRDGNLALGVAADSLKVVSRGSRSRVREVFIDSTAVTRQWTSRRRLTRPSDDPVKREWLAVSMFSDLDGMASANKGMAPWRRLRALLRIERHDIAVVAVYAAALGLLSLVIPVATQALVNTVAFGAVLQPLVVLTAALFVGLALAGGLSVLQSYIVEVFQRRILVRFAEDLGGRLPRVSEQARDHHDLVELNNRFLDVITIQKTSAELLLVGLAVALQTVVGLILLGLYHPSLLAFSVVLLCGIGLVSLLGRGGTESAVAESKTKFAIVGWLDELAGAPHLFAAGHGQVVAAERTADKVHAYVDARRWHYRHVFSVLIGGVSLQVLAFVALLGVGGYLVIERELTLGQLIAAEIVVGAIAIGIGKLGRLADKTFDLVAATDKLGVLLDLPLRQEGSDPLPTDGPDLDVATRGLVLGGPHFSMPAMTLRVEAGEKVQLVGASGSGKTLLLQALAGQRAPIAGEITWGGRSRPDQDALARSVFLAREDAIIAGTVFDNLRLADPDLTDEKAWTVLETVALSADVARLGGLGSTLFRGGAPLSSSQRRRLVLARALVASPRLLLIDGALDFVTEDQREAESILSQFVGGDAAWSAVVVSNDPRVAHYLSRRISLSPDQGRAES